MADQLTSRQRRILEVIRDAVSDRGYPPSIREIGEAVGLTSTSSVHSQLEALQRKGFIRRDPTKPRAIEVHFDDPVAAVPRPLPTYVPLMSAPVAAGTGTLPDDVVEELLPLPRELVGQGDCKGRTEGACTSPISAPVKTQFGWHVIQVTGVQLPKLNEQLRGQLDPGLQQRRQAAVQGWFSKRLKAARVTVNPRFGRWDAAAGKVVDRETAPQPTVPPKQPAGGSVTTTTQP
jgi:hypothetical protein